jgi:hypothetical protein
MNLICADQITPLIIWVAFTITTFIIGSVRPVGSATLLLTRLHTKSARIRRRRFLPTAIVILAKHSPMHYPIKSKWALLIAILFRA